jgi:Fe2+ or Zn2+ uptake regulation protein
MPPTFTKQVATVLNEWPWEQPDHPSTEAIVAGLARKGLTASAAAVVEALLHLRSYGALRLIETEGLVYEEPVYSVRNIKPYLQAFL